MRYEIRTGKFGQYFWDNQGGGGWSVPLEIVLEKLNRLEEYKARLAKANKGRPSNKTF